MKIIDKNKDYYDYVQNIYPDSTYTFDRRGSVIFNNETICSVFNGFWGGRNGSLNDSKYLILQIGFTNWLMKITSTKIKIDNLYHSNIVTDYDIELVDCYKDYKKLHSFRLLEITDYVDICFWKKYLMKSEIENIKLGNCKYHDLHSNNYFIKDDDIKLNYYPILKDTKIPSIISADEIYKALEEYFIEINRDKEYNNQSDVEKIESHGFDKKSSFRNLK